MASRSEKTFNLPARAYKKQFERVFKNSQKTAKEFGEQQAKLFLKEVVPITPPGGKQTRGGAAKLKGEEAVEGDIRNLFIPVAPSKAETGDLKGKHKSARTGRGRIRKKPARRWRVARGAIASYVAQKKKLVGFLASGLNIASARFGYKPPAWIWRHRSPGSVRVKISKKGMVIKMTNAIRFASNVRDLERRFNWALERREKALKRLANQYAKKLKRGTIFR
ncbi:MAG: hypothetical protein ACTSU8_05795 [Alphaproteobacteria bacterium]